MENRITFWLGAVLLWAALDCSQAQVIPSYFVVGGNLELRPTVSEPITNILWKYSGNLLAEWVKGEVDLTYYDKYEGRTTLDPDSGRLEVKNMNKTDEGLYTVEINNRVHGESYTVKSITTVPKPSVVVRTLICSPDLERCLLTCDGNEPESLTEAEPIEYSWKMGENNWEKKTKDFNITSDETRHAKMISCRMKNPVSQKDSEPVKNPLYKEPVNPQSGSGSIVGIVIGVLILALVVVFVLLMKFRPDLIRRLIPQRRGGVDIESPSNKGHQLDPASPKTQPDNTSEGQPLIKPEGQPNNTPVTKPGDTSETKPGNTPVTKPDDTPETKPDDTSEGQRNNTPEGQPNNTSETKPDDTPVTKPGNTSETKPDDTPETKPEDTPEAQPDKPPVPETDPPTS